jgi:hypothetical protein
MFLKEVFFITILCQCILSRQVEWDKLIKGQDLRASGKNIISKK